MSSPQIAVVGAGVAGAGVAYALRDAPVSVTVFERSNQIGGRAATHSTHGHTYDPGANYLKSDDPAVTNLITETLDTEGLIDIAEPVWTFTEDRTIAPGDDDDAHKWSYEDGVAELPRRLFAESNAAIVRNTTATEISRNNGGWTLTGEDRLGTYEAVVLTPPAPQTAALLSTADDYEELQTSMAAIEYRSICTVVLGYSFELNVPYYALVNTDRNHDIGWLSREECKSGHVPAGESLLVVQMAPDWSARRIEEHPNETAIVHEVAERTATLLEDERLRDPNWTATAAWSNALPARDTEGIDPDPRRRAERDGLYLAGDWVIGEGRIHRALQSGRQTGLRVGKP